MSSILSPKSSKLKKNIELFETEGELPEWFYEKCVEEFKKVDLCTTDVNDITRIVSPFLANWGLMGRVIFDKRRSGWERKLARTIRDKCEIFKDLREKNLDDYDVNLAKLESEIKECYEKIVNLIAPTSTSKVLHLICPKFFPMWDMAIRDGVGKAMRRNQRKYRMGSSATGYFKFMNEIQRFIKKNKSTLAQLQQRYHKSPVRLSDEHFWQATDYLRTRAKRL